MKIKSNFGIGIFFFLSSTIIFSCSVEIKNSPKKPEKVELDYKQKEIDTNSLKNEIRDIEFEYNFEKKNYEEITNAIEVVSYDLRIDDSNKKYLNIKVKFTSPKSINNILLYYGDLASYGNSFSESQGIYSEFNIDLISNGTVDLRLYSDKLPSKIDFERQKDQEKYYDSLNSYGPPDTLSDGSTIKNIIAYPKHDVFIYRIRYQSGEYVESVRAFKWFFKGKRLELLKDSLNNLRNKKN